MFEELGIISYPDPRLRRVSVPVEAFDDKLVLWSAGCLNSCARPKASAWRRRRWG